jgi:hypothetical protein
MIYSNNIFKLLLATFSLGGIEVDINDVSELDNHVLAIRDTLSQRNIDTQIDKEKTELPAYSFVHDLGLFLSNYKHFAVVEYGDDDQGVYLDRAVIKLEQEATRGIQPLFDLIQRRRYVKEDNFLGAWWNFLVGKLEALRSLPKRFVVQDILANLYGIYANEYYRLTKPIGSSEFAEFLRWPKNKFRAYMQKPNVLMSPYIELKSTPLWTVGQAEAFNRVLLHRDVTKFNKGDWKTQHVHQFEEKRLVLIRNEIGLYNFHALSSGNVIESLYERADKGFNNDEVQKIANYLFEISNEPMVFTTVSEWFALYREDIILARTNAETALSLYNEIIPNSFDGKFDVEDNYISTLVIMTYIEATEGNFERAIDLMGLAAARTDIDAQTNADCNARAIKDGLTILYNHPDSYAEWYYDNR